MTTEQQKPFADLGYEPVPAIVNRILARYLRAQRKNMQRFFEDRGLFTLANRMKQIRKSRQDMMAKNLMFQGVLNDYSKLVTPTVTPSVPGSVLQSPPAVAVETKATDQ
jgi:hypothetical protein